MTPTFSAISDLYSPTQLQRALFEASQIAKALQIQLWSLDLNVGYEMSTAIERLDAAGADAAAEYEASMKRTAPKPQECANG